MAADEITDGLSRLEIMSEDAESAPDAGTETVNSGSVSTEQQCNSYSEDAEVEACDRMNHSSGRVANGPSNFSGTETLDISVVATDKDCIKDVVIANGTDQDCDDADLACDRMDQADNRVANVSADPNTAEASDVDAVVTDIRHDNGSVIADDDIGDDDNNINEDGEVIINGDNDEDNGVEDEVSAISGCISVLTLDSSSAAVSNHMSDVASAFETSHRDEVREKGKQDADCALTEMLREMSMNGGTVESAAESISYVTVDEAKRCHNQDRNEGKQDADSVSVTHNGDHQQLYNSANGGTTATLLANGLISSECSPNGQISSNMSLKVEEVDNQELVSGACKDDIITAEERCEAMLAAMDVQSAHRRGSPVGSTMSVEACLARFTDRETLSGANMITCETCSRAAAAAACNGDVEACGASDDNNNATADSRGDHLASSSSSKTSGTGRCHV